jgi:hypothetical protein
MVIRRASFGSAIHYLDGRRATLERYLNTFYTPYDWHIIKRFFWDNPIQAKVILKDFSKSNDAKLGLVAQIFIQGKSKIVFVVGARGSGKTATAFMFAEQVNIQTSRPVFYVTSNDIQNALPRWMKIVPRVSDVPQGSFGIIDESAIQFSSRDAMKEDNKLLGKELAIARHKGIFLIFITQHIAMSDINLDRLKDLVIWKQSNDYSFGTRDKSTKEGKFWDKVRTMMSPRAKQECLFEYPAQRRFINFSHGLPDCWSDDLSKSWKDAQLGKKKEEKIIKPKKPQKEAIYI